MLKVCKGKHHIIRGDCGQFLRSTWQLLPCLSIHLQGRYISPPQYTLIWKIYPPLEPKSQQKYTGTLGKPSPLTPLQLQNPLPKSCWAQKSKPKRLSRLEVSQFIVKNNIHHATELYAAAEERRKEGQTDLAGFVLSCTKKLSMILLRAPGKCKMQRLPSKEGKHPECRVLERVRLSSCVDGCDMEWYICSRDILQ